MVAFLCPALRASYLDHRGSGPVRRRRTAGR